MRFCLICRRLSPSGSVFCSSCGCTFEGRICPSHHVNPPTALFCVRCGRPDMTTGARSINFGCLPMVLAWGFVLLIAAPFVHPAEHLLMCLISRLVSIAIAGYLIIFVFLNVVPGPIPGHLQRLTSVVLKFGLRWLGIGLGAVARYAIQLVMGRRPKP